MTDWTEHPLIGLWLTAWLIAVEESLRLTTAGGMRDFFQTWPAYQKPARYSDEQA